jgi:hypothetical protein
MSRAPIKGAQTLGSLVTSYLNDKFIDHRLGHLGSGGVRVILDDVPEKVWKGIVGPEFVRLAEDRDLQVAAAHFGSHEDNGITLEVLISSFDPMDLAKQGWVLTEHDVDGIDYYSSPRMS